MNDTKRSSWAWAGVAAYLLTSGLGATVWAMQSDEALETKTVEVGDLRGEVERLEQEAALEEELLLQLERLREATSRYMTILPPPEVATPERLLGRVQDRIARAGVHLQTYTGQKDRRKKVGSRGRSPTFSEVRLDLRLQGTHAGLLKLVNLLERDAELIRINSFSLQPVSQAESMGDQPELLMNLSLSTFRYTPSR